MTKISLASVTDVWPTEHVEKFLMNPDSRDLMEKTVQHYKTCLRVIFENTPIIPQTAKTSKDQAFTTLTPNYLCIQCSVTTTDKGRRMHGEETKHRFCMFHLGEPTCRN